MAKNRVPAGATAKTPAQVQATLALRTSGASGRHDSRPKRARTRAASKRAALREF
jgi:hypothetical protein